MVFKILALGGGGTKGILHIGAIKFLEEKYGNLQEHFSGGFYGCSVGSMMATCLAFGMKSEDISRVTSKFSSFSQILFEELNLSRLKGSLANKGLFDPKCIEDFTIKMLESEGLDLKGKRISDAPYPLFICCSNLTKKMLTVFKGDVLILDAISASCCIPFLFCPKVINNCAYLDGGYLTNILTNFIPPEDRQHALVVSIVYDNPNLSPSKISTMSTISYLYALYMSTCIYARKMNASPNEIRLCHSLSSGLSDVSDEDRADMIASGYELTRLFCTKSSI
jgi:predicted acylesterase/phospholipase RssA